MRFRPPAGVLPAGARWALARAFWPPAVQPPAVEAASAIRDVEALRLGARIASRIPAWVLESELGPAGASRLREKRAAAAARTLLVRRSLLEALAVARRAEMAPVLLKFAALEALGALSEASRGASDVDLLLDSRSALALREALLAEGWRATAEREEEHHLAAVSRPPGLPIEIHTRLPGIRVGTASVDAAGLEEAGLLELCEGVLIGARVPKPEVVVAHLLVHGLAQHGASPRAYPMFQPFADAIDLGWPGKEWRVGAEAIAAWVERSVSRAELEAAARLCVRLAEGDPLVFDESASDSAEAALLHHCVWGMLDEGYRASLRLRAVGMPLSDLPTWRAGLREVRRALAPRASELVSIYGGRPSRGRLLWLRFYRPFDLVGRTVGTLVRKAQVRRG